MAEATSQLQRIADLVQRAGTISGKQRGMRIEAEDWNTMVDILLGVLQIDRLQEQSQTAQLEQRFALRDHEHLGEVNVAWLEPSLQTGLSGGNGVTTRQVLADMDRKIVTVQEQVAAVQTVLDAHQRQLDRMSVDEIGRSKLLRGFDTKFEGVVNTRTAVQTLSTEVSALRSTFDEVLELRKVLTDRQGTAIDVSKVRDEVTDLQSLRESLSGVDGKPLTLRELETRIAEIADVVGVGNDGGLQKRLADGFAQVESTLSERTQSQLAEGLAAITEANVALESRVRTLVDTTAALTAATASADLAEQIDGVESRFTTTLDQRLSTAAVTTNEGLESVRDELDRRMAEVPQIARTAAVTASVSMGDSVTADLTQRLTADIGVQVTGAEGRLATRIGSLEAGLLAVRQDVPSLVGNVVRDATAALDTSLTQKVSGQVAAAEGRLQTAIPVQISAAVNASLAGVDARIAATVAAQTPAIDLRIDQRVGAATQALDARVVSEVGRQLGTADIDGRITRAVQASAVSLQGTVAAQLLDQQARLTTTISNTSGALRNEVFAALDNAIGKTRVELLDSLDDRLLNLDTLISRQVQESVNGQFKLATRTVDERITKIESVLAIR